MTNLTAQRSVPLIYAITDRRLLPRLTPEQNLTTLIDFIEQTVNAGVDMVQIRERDLTAGDLYYLTRAVVERCGKAALITVNDRADIAACARAGVHLTVRSLSAEVVRRDIAPEILIGASTHNKAEAEAAERGGADFIVFGPVFETASKLEFGDPVGINALHEVADHIDIPVIALGGINLSNCREALDAGAAGIAGISMFVEAFLAQNLNHLVAAIKNLQQG